MSSDIFKINRNFIDLSSDLSYTGRSKLLMGSPYYYLLRNGSFTIPKVIFGELSGSELGHYDSSQHLIVIDMSLTPEVCRKTLDNVYLHELAHAIDYCINKGSKHDSKFVEICKNIGADPEFAKAKVNVNKNHIKSKIDKLLALSKSDFDGEASSALNKAKQLMLSSGLSYLYSDEDDELFGCIFENKKTLGAYKRLLMPFVCRITGAFYFLSSNGKRKTIEVYGSADQVETTMYVYNDLITKIESEYKKIAKEYKENLRSQESESEDPMIRLMMRRVTRINSSQIKLGIVRGIMAKNSDIEKSVKGTAIELSSAKSQEIYSRLYNTRFRNVALRTSAASSQMGLGMSAGQGIGVSFSKGAITKQIGYNG